MARRECYGFLFFEVSGGIIAVTSAAPSADCICQVPSCLATTAIQEPLLGSDSRMTFCAAVDRNAYLPVHNRFYSKPQKPDDPAWNTANCRNRRIFDDRAGLCAARNVRPALIQSYPRDMGNGVVIMMREIDAPIRVFGKHWGALRTAYKI